MKLANPQLDNLLQGLFELVEHWQDEVTDIANNNLLGCQVYEVCANDLETLIEEFREDLKED